MNLAAPVWSVRTAAQRPFALALVLLVVALSTCVCAQPKPARHPVSSARVKALALADAAAAFERYKWLHQHPELSNQEQHTAAYLAKHLTELGFEVHAGVGGNGLLAWLEGQRPGVHSEPPVVLYRADMDALPVTEQTGLPYSSQTPGVMHACGHDLHMAVALSSLRLMAQLRKQWSGTILFVAQPAEELGLGAKQILADPQFAKLLERVGRPRLALALHDSPDLPAGTVAVSAGYVTANVDSVDIQLFGRGGHGARPHQAIDPVVMASELVLALQTIVSRRIAPDKPAVVTVGRIQAGTKNNIIPPEAELLLTVRSYDDDTRRKLLSEIKHLAATISEAYHAPRPPVVNVKPSYTPSGYNDPKWSQRLRSRFERAFGKQRVVDMPPTMGGEDFARYARQLKIPGVMWRLGAVAPRTFAATPVDDLPSLHSPKFAPDAQAALPVGVQTVVLALLDGLSSP